jgi:hypothetical protein
VWYWYTMMKTVVTAITADRTTCGKIMYEPTNRGLLYAPFKGVCDGRGLANGCGAVDS